MKSSKVQSPDLGPLKPASHHILVTGKECKMPSSVDPLITRFETTFNQIQDLLQKELRLGFDEHKPFSQLVKDYFGSRNNRKKSLLLDYGKLRNAIVHKYFQEGEYCAVPNKKTVENIELILKELQNPPKVIPDYQGDVIILNPKDHLEVVLELISKNDFSQFPVYEDKKSVGLLTENGITRALANMRSEEIIEFKGVSVSNLLKHQEVIKNLEFISRTGLFEDAASLFSKNIYLEAILITNNGKPGEKPLGIITRWDILHPKKKVNQF